MNKSVKYPSAILAIVLGILAVEGGYVNHPSDPGGETNKGITKTTAVEHGYTGSMKDLPDEVAIDIYAQTYVYKPGFDGVVELSEPVGTKLVDAGVNVGQVRAARWYQTSLNSFSRSCRDYPCVKVDGVIGSNTLAAHRALIAKRGSVLSCKLMLRSLNAQQGYHYLSLTSLQDFTVGWFSHRIGNISEELCDEH